MMLVMRARARAAKPTPLDGAQAAEGDARDPSRDEVAGSPARARTGAATEIRVRGARRRRAARPKRAASAPDHAARRDPAARRAAAAPKKSRRYSASADSTSGSSDDDGGADQRPVRSCPAPPTSRPARTGSTGCSGNVSGRHEAGERREEPAGDARERGGDGEGERPRRRSGSSPIDPAAGLGIAHRAHARCPSRSRAKRQIAARARRATADDGARSRCRARPSASRRARGGGMSMMPLAPPVTSRHSIAPCSTTNANAIVTIARYGPLTRNAGSAEQRRPRRRGDDAGRGQREPEARPRAWW